MNTAEINGAKRADETLIIAKSDEGFRVCSPLTPGKQYVVTGLPNNPHCSCPEFAGHDGDPEWLCQHILAVLKETGTASQARPSPTPGPAGNRGPGDPPSSTTRKAPGGRNGEGASMLLKRSVSPDGRIDSLSVEFSCPIGRETPDALKQRAEKILSLQAEIAAGFLKANGNGSAQRDLNRAVNAVAAQLLAVASMNGRYGRRLFLNVLVNGQVLKFFGSDKQLAEAVTAAGYASVAEHLSDGCALNLPCRAVTKPSPDGRYINVERLLPAQAAPQP